ncbi:MAG: hypothetical protein CL910_03225 [Deltaproteobacteria bacterium]|nr:hypothetical protein [Deltaproteobacteria bacterium]
MKTWWNRLVDAWTDLNGRERALVGAVGVVALLGLFWLTLVAPTLDWAASAERRAATARDELRAVQALRSQFDRVNAPLSRVRERIHSGPKGEIFTTLEDLARKSAVKVASMEPRTSPASEAYKETKVQVVLKSVSLAQTVNYLHRIESAPQLLSVKSLRIRARADKPELLDVTFTVSSFEPVPS